MKKEGIQTRKRKPKQNGEYPGKSKKNNSSTNSINHQEISEREIMAHYEQREFQLSLGGLGIRMEDFL